MDLILNIKSLITKVYKQGFCFLFVFSQCLLFGQNSYWIYLDAKSPMNDLAISQMSLLQKQTQGIVIDIKDLDLDTDKLDLIRNQGYELVAKSRWLNAVVVASNDYPKSLEELNFVKRINKVKQVSIPKSLAYQKSARSASDSSYYGIAWNQIKMLNGHLLHEAGYRGEDINIGVFDNGFVNMDSIIGFDSLFMEDRVKYQWDYINNDSLVFDGGSHGTAVMSTMAALWPDSMVGTAPKANYFLFHTENDASETLQEEYNWVVAAEKADSLGVQVMNTSLGYTAMDDDRDSHTYDDMDGNTTAITIAADIAASKGMLVISSAGNSGMDDWYYISAPADGDSVLAIGAVDGNGDLASFSSRGPSADGRVKPNVVAQGRESAILNINGDLSFSNGTSFSGPITTGLAACLWQAHPDKSNMEVFKAIEQSADQYLNPDDDYGYGLPDFWKAHLILADSIEADTLVTHTGLEPEIWYNNPINGALNFSLGSSSLEQSTISCYNVAGQLLYSEDRLLYNGINKVEIDAGHFDASSFLIIRIATTSATKTIKVIR